MKTLTAVFIALTGIALAAGCGGGGGSPAASTPPPKPAAIDPSGNWSMSASDSGGVAASFASLFAQVGSIVTSNSFTASGNPAPFACVPFSATLANGQVLNVNNFTGDVNITGFATFSFNATLAADGKSFTGTYASMPPCAGLLTSGTFTGSEIPTTTGSWTGTLQPCTLNQQTGVCTSTGAPSGTLTAALVQDDLTGNVTGTYQVAALAAFSTGAIGVAASDQDILSGKTWQFTMTDASGAKFIANGLLDLTGKFSGIVTGAGSTTYLLAMTH